MKLLSQIFLAVLLLLSTKLFSQAEYWRFYSSPERVNAIAEKDNVLWLATNAGVVRIDKNTFEKTTYTPGNSELPSYHIQAIKLDASGHPWIGTYDDILSMFDGTHWHNLNVPDSLESQVNSNTLYCMDIDQNDVKWIGTSNGLIRYDGAAWQRFQSADTGLPNAFLNSVWAMVRDNDGNLIVASNKVYKYTGDQWYDLSGDGNDIFAYGNAKLYKDHNGTIWFNNDVGDVCSYNAANSSWTIFNQIGSNQIGITENENGHMVVLTYNGLVEYNNGAWSQFNNLLTNELGNILDQYYIDQDQQIWGFHGTRGARKTQSALQDFSLHTSIQDNGIVSMAEASDGKIYVAEAAGEIDVYDYNAGWAMMDIPSDDGNMKKIAFGPNDKMWLLNSSGLYLRNGNSWEQQTLQNSGFPISGNGLSDMAVAPNGDVWVCGASGLAHYNGSAWELFTTANSMLATNAVLRVAVAPNGNVWAATYGTNLMNLYQIQGANWKRYYSGNSPIPSDKNINVLYADSQNRIWCNIYYELFRFDGTDWKVFGQSDGWEFYANGISDDASGKIYVGTWIHGLYIIDGNDQFAQLNNVGNPLLAESTIASVMADSQGSIWMGVNNFGTQLGLQVFNPDAFQTTGTTTPSAASTTLQVYPNPATDLIHVSYEARHAGESSLIRLIDAYGNTIQQSRVNASQAGLQNDSFFITGLPQGVYFVELQQDGKRSATQVVVE